MKIFLLFEIILGFIGDEGMRYLGIKIGINDEILFFFFLDTLA